MTSSLSNRQARILHARDNWSDADWDTHFRHLKVRPAIGARYGASSNDVLKVALLHEQKHRCWWQGSQLCRSRALLAREAQIDHVIPKGAKPSDLENAIRESSYQHEVFDVHDPGNLAIICGPCNQEKGTYAPGTWSPAMAQRRARIEAQRESVIRRWHRWHALTAIDESGLHVLRTLALGDPVVQEIYASLAAEMIQNLATQAGHSESLRALEEVEFESSDFYLLVRPSDEAIDAEVEMMAEMRAEDRRHGI